MNLAIKPSYQPFTVWEFQFICLEIERTGHWLQATLYADVISNNSFGHSCKHT